MEHLPPNQRLYASRQPRLWMRSEPCAHHRPRFVGFTPSSETVADRMVGRFTCRAYKATPCPYQLWSLPEEVIQGLGGKVSTNWARLVDLG
jgi:hypothetical protein